VIDTSALRAAAAFPSKYAQPISDFSETILALCDAYDRLLKPVQGLLDWHDSMNPPDIGSVLEWARAALEEPRDVTP
jgi:hypothetical protein